jgi:hypothetical protein
MRLPVTPPRWEDPATQQLCVAGASPAGHVITCVLLNIMASAGGLTPVAADPMPVIDPSADQLCVATVLAGPPGHVAELCRPSSGSWLQFDLTALYGGPAAASNVEPPGDPQTKDPVGLAGSAPPVPVIPPPPVTVTTPIRKAPGGGLSASSCTSAAAACRWPGCSRADCARAAPAGQPRAVNEHGIRLMPWMKPLRSNSGSPASMSGMTRSISPKIALSWTRASEAPMQ